MYRISNIKRVFIKVNELILMLFDRRVGIKVINNNEELYTVYYE